MSPELEHLTVADDPAGWSEAGFSVTGGRTRIDRVTLSFAGTPGRTGILDWSLSAVTAETIDGLRVVPIAVGHDLGDNVRPAAATPDLPARSPDADADPHPVAKVDGGRGAARQPASAGVSLDHPNGALAIDHVVVASGDLDRTIEALERHGILARRTRETDQRGAPLRQVFFRLGRPILELIGPPEPSGTAGASFWGLAITVADLDRTKDLLGDRLGDPRKAVQPDRRIATLRHRDLGVSVPIAFMSS